MPSSAAYTSLAVARSETGCSTVLIPWVEEPVIVTPEVVGPVGIVWLEDEREVRNSTARSPGWRLPRRPFVLTGPSPQEEEDHRAHVRAVAMEAQGCVRIIVRDESSREW